MKSKPQYIEIKRPIHRNSDQTMQIQRNSQKSRDQYVKIQKVLRNQHQYKEIKTNL